MWSVFSGMNDTMKLFDAFDRQLAQALAGREEQGVPFSFADKGEELVFSADVPGVKRSDIEITIDGDVLHVRAVRQPTAPEGFKLARRERGTFGLSRKLALPCRIDADAVRADLTGGVLTVSLPKASEAKPRRIPVNAAS
jgi:HSP20 family protein